MAAVLMVKARQKDIIMKDVDAYMRNMDVVQMERLLPKELDSMDALIAVHRVGQFGCCPDGKTPARGSHKEGCPCQYTRYGCCPDGETTALGPRNDGCDDCRYAKYGCCPDGESKAIGPDYAGCPSTTLAPFLLGGTVAPSKISSCALPQDQGTVCSSGYKLVWYYDTAEGRCSQFWYGGCDGNDNRFATKEQCETICVEPPGIGELNF
ncbi:Kunitz/Bovine pancreatic trypsin inhibitor domain protein [Cooperia oncophora]